MTNYETIEKFYQSFAAKDIEGMLSCYHPNIQFEDPAFGKLSGERAKNMWRMLLANSKGGIKLTYSSIKADEQKGSANWRAEYIFSQTGRNVVNRVAAQFEFENGKIIKHTDNFDLHTWAKQAMGIAGFLLGWTAYFKNQLQHKTNALLDNFISKQTSL
jgi:ketosteroid isomerase-like protein